MAPTAHLSLEEGPQRDITDQPQGPQLLVLSAQTSTALDAITDQLAAHLQTHPDLSLADVAFTLHAGRHDFSYRRFVVCQELDEAAALLLQRPSRYVQDEVQERRDRPVVFMFPGLGDHYEAMGLRLYQSEPIFRQTIDRCCSILKPFLRKDLREVLYPSGLSAAPASSTTEADKPNLRELFRAPNNDSGTQKSSSLLDQTLFAQPALFIIEYALAQLWIAWGVTPSAMIGYSLGEYVAACLADVLTLEEALYVVVRRAQLIQELPTSAMLAVMLGEQDIQPYVSKDVTLSAVNGSSYCVLGGSTDSIEAVGRQLHQQGVAARRIKGTHAFHSVMMEPIAEAFRRCYALHHVAPAQDTIYLECSRCLYYCGGGYRSGLLGCSFAADNSFCNRVVDAARTNQYAIVGGRAGKRPLQHCSS